MTNVWISDRVLPSSGCLFINSLNFHSSYVYLFVLAALGALRRCVDWPVRILAYASMDHYFLFEVGSKDVSRWLLM